MKSYLLFLPIGTAVTFFSFVGRGGGWILEGEYYGRFENIPKDEAVGPGGEAVVEEDHRLQQGQHRHSQTHPEARSQLGCKAVNHHAWHDQKNPGALLSDGVVLLISHE